MQLGNKDSFRESILDQLTEIGNNFDELNDLIPKDFVADWKRGVVSAKKAITENKLDLAIDILDYIKNSFNSERWIIPHKILEGLINVKITKCNRLMEEIKLLKLKSLKPVVTTNDFEIEQLEKLLERKPPIL
jgi:hypothetical protein